METMMRRQDGPEPLTGQIVELITTASFPRLIGTLTVFYGIVLLVRALYVGFTCQLAHIPGPWYTRFTHLRLKKAVITGQRIFYIDSLHKTYGPVVRLTPTEVGIADPDGFTQIHRVGSGFLKSDWYPRLANFPKLGVFTMLDPREHGARRRLLSRPFSRSHLMEHWDPVVKEKVEMCVGKIMRDTRGEGGADMFNWWMLMASDVSAHLAFGESFNMVANEKKSPLMTALKKLTIGAGMSVEMPFLRLLRLVPLETVQKVFNANAYILKGAEKAVQNAHNARADRNMFARVLETSKKEGEGHLDDMDLKIEAMNLIIAGTDTTGVSTTYMIYEVLRHPDVRRKLEQEVKSLPPDFTDADLVKLEYLNAVVEESMRLDGAAPSSLPRVVPEGDATIAGTWIPGGITVCTQAYTLHRLPALWENPLQFEPERWLGEKMNPKAKAVFCPFGAGARSCIGIHLARMELRYAATLFFRECSPDMQLAPSCTPESMDFINFFLIAPKGQKCEVMMPGLGAREV